MTQEKTQRVATSFETKSSIPLAKSRLLVGFYCCALVFLFSSQVVSAFSVVPQDTNGSGNNNSQSEESNENQNHMSSDTCSNPEPIRHVDPHGKDPNMTWYQYDTIDSTQNKAMALVENGGDSKSSKLPDIFAVTAVDQSNGRGTSNRTWYSKRGNTLVTIAMRSSSWPRRIPLTLLPLQVGIVMASEVASHLTASKGNVTLKWPNDVLVDRQKIAGVLIESAKHHDVSANTYDYFMLIGIGVNVGHAPTISTTGTNYGRASTCLRNHLNSTKDKEMNYESLAQTIGLNLAYRWSSWISQAQQVTPSSPSPESIISEWERRVDWDMELQLRNEQRQRVKPLGIHPDGRLRVRDERGADRLLVSDYFI